MIKNNFRKILTICIMALLSMVITAQTTEARMLRWKTMPIKVCLPDNTHSTLMKKAFYEWTKITNGKVRFLYTCTDAQITVSYSPKKVKSLTTYSFDSNGYIFKSHIDMGLLTQQGNVSPDELLLLVMEHEIAHALGIEGHVNTPKSIMRPTVELGYTITSDTLAEINKRYK